jgi:acetoacetyl-CoA synthetase
MTAVAIIFRDETGAGAPDKFQGAGRPSSRSLQQALRGSGRVGKGDRVAGYMPNMPETLIGAMAAASLGAIWSSASPDFGVQGVVDRFRPD